MQELGATGLVVSVDYGDLLAITLPRNIKHFHRCLVITTAQDEETKAVAKKAGAEIFVTDAFYRYEAVFNKGLAIEEAFEHVGRYGWMALWDADTLFPATIAFQPKPGKLYSPKRRMLANPAEWEESLDWGKCPVKREKDFAGYCQIFHASDAVLNNRPWYSTNWRHAGGCDTVFQAKWTPGNRIRPPFEVLHIGPDGRNWCGRCTPRRDGVEIPRAEERAKLMEAMRCVRKKTGGRSRKHQERIA